MIDLSDTTQPKGVQSLTATSSWRQWRAVRPKSGGPEFGARVPCTALVGSCHTSSRVPRTALVGSCHTSSRVPCTALVGSCHTSSRVPCTALVGSCHTSDINIVTPVVTLPASWRYGASSSTG